MIRHKNVRLNLRNLMLDNVSGLPTERSWENVDFEPPAGDETSDPSDWIREKYMAGDDVLRANNRLQSDGVYAIDLFTPRDTGTNELEDLADDIKSAMKAGTSLSGPSVQIVRASRGEGRQSGDWYMIPVRISFRTFANNN